jgi:hypothetical protein
MKHLQATQNLGQGLQSDQRATLEKETQLAAEGKALIER